MIKAVIFDMDGTFVDSEHLHKESEVLQMRKYNVELTDDDKNYFFGRPAKDIFAYLIEKYKLTASVDQLIEENNELFIQVAGSKIRLYDGFHELVSYLKEHYKLGLVTSSNRKIQGFAFKKFGLDGVFDAVVTIEMVKNGKPDPEPYVASLSQLGIGPLDAIVLEDSPNGILSAKRAGIITLAIGHTATKESLLHSQYYINDLKEAKNWFEKQYNPPISQGL